MIHSIPEEGVIFRWKPGIFGNPVVELKVLRDRYLVTRKKSALPETIMFEDIFRLSTSSRYVTDNTDYRIAVYLKNKKSMDFILDPGSSMDEQNYIQTKTCLTAYTQYMLKDVFPENIDELDIDISANLNTKAGIILLSRGNLVINGQAYPTVSLDSARFVDEQITPYVILHFADGKKDKIKYISSLNLTVIEAVLLRNTGHGIDFTKGDGIKHRTAQWARDRFIDDNTLKIE